MKTNQNCFSTIPTWPIIVKVWWLIKEEKLGATGNSCTAWLKGLLEPASCKMTGKAATLDPLWSDPSTDLPYGEDFVHQATLNGD